MDAQTHLHLGRADALVLRLAGERAARQRDAHRAHRLRRRRRLGHHRRERQPRLRRRAGNFVDKTRASDAATAGDAGGSVAGGVSPAHLAGAPAIPSDDVAAPAEQAITNAPAPKAWTSRVPPRVYGTRSKKTPGPI